MTTVDSERHLLVPQFAGTAAPNLWVGVVDAPLDGLRLVVGTTGLPLSDVWDSFDAGGRRFRSQRVQVPGLPPRASVPAQLLDGGAVVANATITTLPATLPSPVERPFTILFGSCFARAQDPGGDAGSTLGRLPPGSRPDLTILCGDQVYLDTPFIHYLTRTHSPDELAAELLANYLLTWTQAGPLSGFRRIHQLATVAFESDDHDFWNNSPSMATFARDTWTAGGRATWLDIARRLYHQFQAVAAGMTATVGGLSLFVADTRIERTADRFQFMDPAQFDALRTWVHGLAGPGVLVLGQPIFTTEAGLSGYFFDWGLPDHRQYRDLVAVLSATPHDLLVLTGDVHFGRVASCTLPSGRRIVELIASPFALVGPLAGPKWQPAPGMFPAVPVPGVTQVALTTEPYQTTANHAMTVGFSGVGQAVRLTATSWPIEPCQPAVGTVAYTTELH